jgi:hypothetical protein
VRAMGEPGLRVEACSKAVVPSLAGTASGVPCPVEMPCPVEVPCPAEVPDGTSPVKALEDSCTGVLPLMPAHVKQFTEVTSMMHDVFNI